MAAVIAMGDVIIKPIFGSMGHGMVRVSDPDVAFRVVRSLEQLRIVFYVQRAVDHGGRDVRVFVIGGRVLGAIERQAPDGEWRTNVSLGGSARPFDLPPAWEQLALRAAAAMGADYAGVDLLPVARRLGLRARSERHPRLAGFEGGDRHRRRSGHRGPPGGPGSCGRAVGWCRRGAAGMTKGAAERTGFPSSRPGSQRAELPVAPARLTAADVACAAQLACLLEVSAPKPGNVSPGRHFADARYEDFLASAAAIGEPLAGAGTRGIGATVRLAIEATARWTRSNTNLGIVLLLAPIARAALEERGRESFRGTESKKTPDPFSDLRRALRSGARRDDRGRCPRGVRRDSSRRAGRARTSGCAGRRG